MGNLAKAVQLVFFGNTAVDPPTESLELSCLVWLPPHIAHSLGITAAAYPGSSSSSPKCSF